jgi:tagatose 6-phosphate kinase
VIVTVTLNPALDVSYSVDALVPHGSHRVRSVAERAGGKGINVASVLNRMGVPSLALVLAGGSTGRALADDLTARSLSHEVLTCVGETRRTVNVVSSESGDATIFNEPGPSVTRSEIDAVVARVHDHVTAGATVVAICGSLPRGAEPHAYEQIVVAARTPGAVTLVDAEGEPLRAACAARADVALPNRIELVAATGADEETAGAKVLQHLGVRHVVVSAGREGMRAYLADGRTFFARPGQPLRGNPTGAGDAAAAAVAAGLAAGAEWSEILRDAVAWSGAAVLQPVAGEVDPADVVRLRAAAMVVPA